MQQTAAEQPRISGADDDDHSDSVPVPMQLRDGSCAATAGACGASQPGATSHDVPQDVPSDSGEAEPGLSAMPLLRSYGGLPTSIWSNADHVVRRPIKPEPTNRLKVGSTFPEVASAFSGWKPQQSQTLSGTMEAVQSKLVWAGEQLQRTSNVATSTQLCQLMKACAETLAALQNMQ